MTVFDIEELLFSGLRIGEEDGGDDFEFEEEPDEPEEQEPEDEADDDWD